MQFRKGAFAQLTRTLILAIVALLSLTYALFGILTFDVAAQGVTPTVANYLAVAMANNSDAKPLNISNSELGANQDFIASSTPNNLGVFGTRWNTATIPDSLDSAANVFVGIDYEGNVALTSSNAFFDASNSAVYGARGIDTTNSNSPISSVSSTDYSPDSSTAVSAIGVGNGINSNVDFTSLLGELTTYKTVMVALPADYNITDLETPYDFTDNTASGGSGALNPTFSDLNSDGFIVVDFNIPGTDIVFNNLDWVIDSNGSPGPLILFRILNGSNVSIANSSLVISNDDFVPAIVDVGAIFLHASDGDSGDQVFTIGNNVILNGIAFWDLNAIGEGGGDIKTNIGVNNGQGCAQFISQVINFQSGRWVKCSTATIPGSVTAISLDGISINDSPSSMDLTIFFISLLLAGLTTVSYRSMLRRA